METTLFAHKLCGSESAVGRVGQGIPERDESDIQSFFKFGWLLSKINLLNVISKICLSM